MANLVSIDLGFSSVKALDAAGTRPVRFAHAVAPRARQTYHMDSPTRDDMYVTLAEGEEWAVGQTALEQSDSPVGRRDADWIASRECEALLCAAFSELFFGDAVVNLVSGLPLEHYDRREVFRERLLGEHRFRRNDGSWQTITVADCIVAVQGLGAMLNHALTEYGGVSAACIPGMNVPWAKAMVGVIDGGGNTCNYAAYKDLREVGKWTAGADLGLLGPIDAITRKIAADCPKLNPTPVEVASWLERGNFTYLRKSLDMAPYAEAILRDHAGMIWSQAMSVWRSIGRMDAILFTGGQALALGKYMGEQMNGTGDLLVVSEDPVFDNARGYLKLLRYVRRKDA